MIPVGNRFLSNAVAAPEGAAAFRRSWTGWASLPSRLAAADPPVRSLPHTPAFSGRCGVLKRRKDHAARSCLRGSACWIFLTDSVIWPPHPFPHLTMVRAGFGWQRADGHCQAMAVFCDFWTAMDVNGLAVAETSTLGIWVGDQSVSPTAADRSSRQIACPCPASRFRRSHSLSSGWRSGAFERTPRSQ